jgi:hypothetical protein
MELSEGQFDTWRCAFCDFEVVDHDAADELLISHLIRKHPNEFFDPIGATPEQQAAILEHVGPPLTVQNIFDRWTAQGDNPHDTAADLEKTLMELQEAGLPLYDPETQVWTAIRGVGP